AEHDNGAEPDDITRTPPVYPCSRSSRLQQLVRGDEGYLLALLQIPIVIRTTENMLKLVPDSLREAAYALGTPKWKMISAITLKASVSGIITGVLLAIARIAGETAPLLFTSLSNQFWSTDMSQPIANLPVTIFKFAMSPFAEWQELAWAGVLLITLCVLLLNILARVVFAQKKR
ncbi:ABC transporter permease subunit, partial [Hafnia alvei]